jgi:hypothetical protein
LHGWYGGWNRGGWPRAARVDTVRHELATDAFRLRNDRLGGGLGGGEAAALAAEDAAIRPTATRRFGAASPTTSSCGYRARYTPCRPRSPAPTACR